jgi:hypothetical protein
MSAAGAFWEPLLLAVPLLACAITALLIDATLGAARARFPNRQGRIRRRLLTGLLYLLQPLARLRGRIGHGLTPWRRRGPRALGLPFAHTEKFWSEQWRSTEDRVGAIAAALRADGTVVRSGGDWDRWDLLARGGLLGGARLRIGIEEHGAGRQLVRVRWWPHAPRASILLGIAVAAIAAKALITDADAITVTLGAVAIVFVLRLLYECSLATTTIRRALARPLEDEHTVIEQPLPEPSANLDPQPQVALAD